MFGFGVFVEFGAGENGWDTAMMEVVIDEDSEEFSQFRNGNDVVFPFFSVLLGNEVIWRHFDQIFDIFPIYVFFGLLPYLVYKNEIELCFSRFIT